MTLLKENWTEQGCISR